MKKKLEYSIFMNASREKVWNVLIGEKTYPEWTKAFSPSSGVETDWKKGSRALFTDGSGNGMIAEIAENIPNEYLSIRHLGELKDGKEDFTSESVQSWAGALENYTLTEKGGNTVLDIDIQVTDDFADYMNKTWPVALAKVKELAEAG